MNRLFTILSCCLVLGMLCASSWGAVFSEVGPAELKKELEASSRIYVYDVRTLEEYRAGHLPGAINLPPDNLSAISQTLPPYKKAPLVFYCRAEGCGLSHSASLEALKAGYDNIRVLRGGFSAWALAGFDVVK